MPIHLVVYLFTDMIRKQDVHELCLVGKLHDYVYTEFFYNEGYKHHLTMARRLCFPGSSKE